MASIQLSVTALVLILVAMGNSQMSNDASMATIDVSLTTGIDAVPTAVIDASSITGIVASPTTVIDASSMTGIVASPMTMSNASPMTGIVASPTIMSNASPMTGIGASPTTGIDASPMTVIDAASMAGPVPTLGPEAGADGSPLLLPEWAIAFIAVGGVFLVLATIAVVGMCVGIATKSR